MSLPGGISKFCGRIYDISRDNDDLRACLGLELRSQDDVEASLRVSCFKLGPKGLNVEPGRPVPNDEDDDEDDDDDDFGFPGEDDDDEDDDDDDDDVFGLGEDDDESENAVESGEGDYTGFSALSDEFLESFFESDPKDKKKKPTASATKPQPATLKPQVASTVAANRVKPQKVVPSKLLLSTPSKLAAPAATQPTAMPSTVPTHMLYSSAGESIAAQSSSDKVYVSPLQYKPTEKIRPLPNQPLESYIPTMAQLPTAEKVYTSPQQISTDKVYVSTLNLVTENYIPTEDEKESPTGVNYYVPTTQQFQSTERIYLPANLSTTESADSEPVTSTSMTVNIVQSVDPNNTVERLEKPTALPVVESSATEVIPDSEYNEVDSDDKTTVKDIRLSEITTIRSTAPVRVKKPAATIYTTVATVATTHKKLTSTSTTESVKDEDEDDDLSAMVDTAASVFGTDEEQSTKLANNTASDESDVEDGLENSDEDSEEGGIVLGASDSSNSDYGAEEADEDGTAALDEDEDDDDEFRKFKGHTKKAVTTATKTATNTPAVTHTPLSSSTKSSAAVHNGREHKRMNLPPLFSQSPEISSYWSSGGHVYKIRMSPLIQEPATILQNPNRLGRLNLFVPALESNPLTAAFAGKQPAALPPSATQLPVEQTSTSFTASTDFSSSSEKIPHRFKLADVRNQTTTSTNNRSNRNHKRMRMPRTEFVR